MCFLSAFIFVINDDKERMSPDYIYSAAHSQPKKNKWLEMMALASASLCVQRKLWNVKGAFFFFNQWINGWCTTIGFKAPNISEMGVFQLVQVTSALLPLVQGFASNMFLFHINVNIPTYSLWFKEVVGFFSGGSLVSRKEEIGWDILFILANHNDNDDDLDLDDDDGHFEGEVDQALIVKGIRPCGALGVVWK